MTATQITASTGTGDAGRAAARSAVLPTPGGRPRRRGQWTAWAFLAPVVIYLVVFYAYPLYRNLDLSLRDYTVRSFIDGNAPFVWFANYVAVFQDATFWPALANTATFTLVSIAFQYTIGMALAVFFFQRFPLSATLRALFLVPWLLPLLVSASAWSWMLNSDSGVVNAALGAVGIDPVNWLTSPQWALVSVLIANIWIGVPFNLVILYSGLQNISTDIYEAASIDGANALQKFWRITFPLLRPVSAITILLGLVYTLKVFDIIWIMTRGGPGSSSTTFAIWSYRLGFGSALPDLSPAAAVGNLLIVIALVFGLIYIRAQRRLEV
ncbi:carbohydrate ABC transporter permease [Microbacterium sp. SORGH_AS_0421]|uniref:carbohydrate ABC transporter permease n=1 Tax=Microbacterium sp. SORGH_AS_0421 TaxID=3041768 RepID=UPI00278E43F8|nr:sugar ABC transporter permease [Microbacterium sp. SORGH_AS_0421]MDQ1175840.1 multiple sugar transport system permease protein [Microbacterium sp. SORGH_AS_0421]